ncbi:hypothetical protein D3C81_1230790 [compost metagenome]
MARMLAAIAARCSGVAASAPSQAATKASGVSAMATMSPYGTATSVIDVLTMGSCAAMYSSTLVGLMKRVASFLAKGSRHTSQPARKCGSAW